MEALRDVVTVEKSDMSSLRKVVKLKVARGTGWAFAADDKHPAAAQIRAALFERRYLKVTFFDITGNIVLDRDGKVLERALRLADLNAAEVISVEILLPDGLPITEIVIAP